MLFFIFPVFCVAAVTAQDVDLCAPIAGKTFVTPSAALACQKSFPFDESLRQNVLQVVSRVFDFFTFESFYVQSPPPFEESTIGIRTELARISSAQYPVSGYLLQTTCC
jgi:hypothetical protein